MVQITKSMGRMAFAEQHDVAAVQAALANVKIRTNFGQKPLWSRKIDGRNSKDLESAIGAFQCAHNIKQSGKIEAYGPTINALKRSLSASLVGLRGLKGSTAVCVPGQP